MSAMKMETEVMAPVAGTISRVAVAQDDALSAGDLLVELAPS
jgi:biotin carboxyl carrier protein